MERLTVHGTSTLIKKATVVSFSLARLVKSGALFLSHTCDAKLRVLQFQIDGHIVLARLFFDVFLFPLPFYPSNLVLGGNVGLFLP